MSTYLKFRGVIKNIVYSPLLRMRKLTHYPMADFNINSARGYGVIDLDDDGSAMGYSKWVSPKRTRSYPLARLYNTYHLPKRITIIPIIKDEGISGDNDRINFITLSWMNLANVYIILGYYAQARRHSTRAGKITSQLMDITYIRGKIEEIRNYQQTALHWNTMHFERDFEDVFLKAIDSYSKISASTGVQLHNQARNLAVLETFKRAGQFNRDAFKENTLLHSFEAAYREIRTTHALEYLIDGTKGYFSITNWLGGEYHLTADEILYEGDTIIIQESKNASSNVFPSISDIQDGLFKLILFANLDELYLDDKRIQHKTRLKITGKLDDTLLLPNAPQIIEDYAKHNRLTGHRLGILRLLNEEATTNQIEVMLGSH